MDEDVEAVVAAYLKTLEKTSYRLLFGLPEKILPYTPKTIKEAIKRKLALALVSRPEKDLVEKLKSAYAELAKFVPFEEFGLDPDIYAEGPAKFFQASSPDQKSKALKITEKIRRDQESLQREIDAWCRGFRV